MSLENFISQRETLDWFDQEHVSFVDASWYLPAQNRDAKQEYNSTRIHNAVYFDIDLIADPETDLPHMLPHPEVFAEVAGALGLTHEKLIIVYDGPGLFSAPRVWWTLKIMGAKNVKILEGGFDAWKAEGLPIEKGRPNQPKQEIFQTHFLQDSVASLNDLEKNLKSAKSIVLDARPTTRFNGEAPEPREGLRSGHIPKSLSLPFSDLIENGKFIESEKLNKIFHDLKIHPDTQVITTCGSGVTAAILNLALNEANRDSVKLFDGSWAQWGLPDGPEITTAENNND